MAVRVEEIRGLDELQGLQNAWDLLLSKTPHASYFQSLSWLIARWQHGAPEERLRVLAVSDGPELIGLMPLGVKVEKSSVGPMRMLTFPLDGWGSFYGPIGPDTELILRAALEYAWQGDCDFDVADLRGLAVPASSGDWESVAAEDSSQQTARWASSPVPSSSASPCSTFKGIGRAIGNRGRPCTAGTEMSNAATVD